MSELTDLLRRLVHVQPSDQMGFRIYRLSAPSPIAFDDTFAASEATPMTAQPLGSYPIPVSVIRWMDTAEPQNVTRDQQIATQLGAALTFVTNRRIQVAAGEVTTRMEGTPHTHFLPMNMEDSEVIGPVDIDVKGALDDLARSLLGLPEEALEVVTRALELHYAATLLSDTDINTANTLVVAGVESLASEFEKSQPSWEDFADSARFDKAFDDIELTDAQRVRLRAELLAGQHLRLTHRFTTYVMRMLPDTFWDTTVPHYVPTLNMQPDGTAEFGGYQPSSNAPIQSWVPRDPADLKRRLTATYAARSRFVHAGAKAHSPFSTLLASIGESGTRDPIGFAGMRRILRTILIEQIRESSTPEDLPGIRVFPS